MDSKCYFLIFLCLRSVEAAINPLKFSFCDQDIVFFLFFFLNSLILLVNIMSAKNNICIKISMYSMTDVVTPFPHLLLASTLRRITAAAIPRERGLETRDGCEPRKEDKNGGPVNYRVPQPGKRADTQVYHINLLKWWVVPAPALPVSARFVSGPAEPVHKGPELIPAQRQDLTKLEHQYWAVFSLEPRWTR